MGDMPESNRAEVALLDLAVEGWRLARVCNRVLAKLDAGDATRYASQLRYFVKRVEDALRAVDMRLVNLEGQPYDTGLPATPLNIEDFAPEDRLYVDQMLEPVIMGPMGLLKSGTIILKKVN